ncbi:MULTISPECIES: CPBP family intramembrane glutamic endopeptidase [unclassified Bacillus (in: firmicutes)]|uniref:CPBP family intramembrane glutamic endopeptidase n=1 Tax=unclassified Bacillus (in: firmicutes) TaxID=185979 RepID=UPI000BF12DFF|nr:MULTISPECIES: CPBP family intramembrane glutamic endopeptidase [unclassified Bacillus (in: firmicutes)]PEJ53744.1 CPBP family intramembrane metalloprotease [Bacillus sp. AFS002410]PEL11652.1 CPBP family intramembrane metalloprotease [Bacillus sp. AFS017336]
MERELNNQEIPVNYLKKSVYSTQLVILAISIICIAIFIGTGKFINDLHFYKNYQTYLYGFGAGVGLVIFNILLNFVIPERLLDDGGFNKRFFSSLSIPEMTVLCILIALSEELLFRGFIQAKFGLIIASVVFALVHFRYVKKPILLTVVLIESFFLGYLYLRTNNIIIVFLAHFILDYVLGMYMKLSLESEEKE